MDSATSALIGGAVGSIVGIVNVIINSCYTTHNITRQLNAAKQELLIKNEFERGKILENKKMEDKEIIISRILSIVSKNNKTRQYIMDELEATEKTIHEKYTDIKEDLNVMQTKLYISFPSYVDNGYKIAGICNMIWGNEQNFYGYQHDKLMIRQQTQIKLFQQYDDLNEACQTLIGELCRLI